MRLGATKLFLLQQYKCKNMQTFSHTFAADDTHYSPEINGDFSQERP